MSYQIQSILFEKVYFTKEEAIRTLASLKGKLRKMDETEHYYRFRQLEPANLRKRGYNQVRTKEVMKGMKFIIYYKE
jgi:hypothetical protein